jgi:hypothetical protein
MPAMLVVLALVGACTDDDSAEGAGDDIDSLLDEFEQLEPPPLPDQDLEVDAEAGTVVFHGFDDDRGLQTMPSSGGAPTTLRLGDYEGVAAPSVAPDGVTLAVVAWPEGRNERADTLLVGTLDTGFEPLLVDDDLEFWCVRWFPSGDRVLVTAFVEDTFTPRLLEIDLDGGLTEHTVAPGRYDCAIPVDDDRVVLTYLGMETDIQGMAMAELGSEEAELFFMKLGCMIYGGELSPDGTELVTAAACEVPEDSGLHVIDIESGEADHVLAAPLAFPAFSPSGEWIVFGLYPSLDDDDSTIWAIRRDGSGFRQLTDRVGAQPEWVGSS